MENKKNVPRLEIYVDRSIHIDKHGKEEEFIEGDLTAAAKKRLEKIRKEMGNGYLDKLIISIESRKIKPHIVPPRCTGTLLRLVSSVTSEVGRGVIGLTVLQLTIKAISEEQSIRLHKGGGKGENFTWADGLPMRVLDKNFNTPILRKHKLLRLNADGVFMTRSLAENYPYTQLYKAAIKGGRQEWLDIIDMVESGEVNALHALENLVLMLIVHDQQFGKIAKIAKLSLSSKIKQFSNLKDAIKFLSGYIDACSYSARIFEIAMHSYFQTLEDHGAFKGYLKPLSQMRSANKKHGNVGDVEIIRSENSLEVLEAWDAKYGKGYLRDELEELNDKLANHSETELAGFVINGDFPNDRDTNERRQELEVIHNMKIEILTFESWIYENYSRITCPEGKVAKEWMNAFVECLCLDRRKRAPIDEPTENWLSEFIEYVKK